VQTNMYKNNSKDQYLALSAQQYYVYKHSQRFQWSGCQSTNVGRVDYILTKDHPFYIDWLNGV